MAQTPADRRRAQRRTARAVRERRTQLPANYASRARETRRTYAENLRINGPGSRSDEKLMARYASMASWERRNPGSYPDIDPEWEGIGEAYYYHEGV